MQRVHEKRKQTQAEREWQKVPWLFLRRKFAEVARGGMGARSSEGGGGVGGVSLLAEGELVSNVKFLLLFLFGRSMKVNEMRMKNGMATVKQRYRTATHTRGSTSTVSDTAMERTASKTAPNT